MKKHLKLLSLLSLAIAGIGVSFAAVQKETINEPEVKEAEAAPGSIYFMVESLWNGGQDNLSNFWVWHSDGNLWYQHDVDFPGNQFFVDDGYTDFKLLDYSS